MPDGLSVRSISLELGALEVDDRGDEMQGSLRLWEAFSVLQRWSLLLMLASALDLLCSGVIALVAFRHAYHDDAVSLYCIGFQVMSHFLSSFLLILRLMPGLLPEREAEEQTRSTVPDEFLLHEQRRRDLAREKCMNRSVGFLLLAISGGLMLMAVRKFRLWDTWYLDHGAMDRGAVKVTGILAWWGFPAYLAQAALRLAAARRLPWHVAWNGVLVSAASAVLLALLGAVAVFEEEWSWKTEPIVAMALAMALLAEGVRLVCMHNYDVDTWLDQDPRA